MTDRNLNAARRHMAALIYPVLCAIAVTGCRQDDVAAVQPTPEVAAEPISVQFAAPAAVGGNTIVGTDGDDLIIGTDGNDSISGGDGNDYIVGDPSITPVSEFDVVYGTASVDGGNGTLDLTLDIYQSGELCTAFRPYVLIVHGGAFIGGDKGQSNLVDIATALNDLGYVAVSINYRLKPDDPVPSAAYIPFRDAVVANADPDELNDREDAIASAMEDAVNAIRWIELNDLDRCIDTTRYAILGGSAGAFVGMTLTYGLDDFGIAVPTPDAMVDLWGGVFFADSLAFNDPPLLIVHGTDDNTVSHFNQAIAISAEAEAQSIPYTFYSVTDGSHGFGGVGFTTTTVDGTTLFEHTIDFLDTHLSDTTPTYEGRVDIPKQ